ncbi:hypothetical protein D3Z51_16690 [Clostridiaceae bacterium]|nr:hypothetical protein [Clostridiaceae bacterium]RKI10174.1 hypothetical protein D7V81_16150 [bacterium 1XD21-70]
MSDYRRYDSGNTRNQPRRPSGTGRSQATPYGQRQAAPGRSRDNGRPGAGRSRDSGRRGAGRSRDSASSRNRPSASGGGGRMTNSERRIVEDERARARARARKKRRRRQRKLLLGAFCLLVLCLVGGAVFAVARHKREKQKQEFLEAGIGLLEEGKFEEAIAQLDDALQWSKEEVGEFETTVLLYRADAEFRLPDYSAAQDTYEILLKADPENADYKKGAALCLVEKGDYDAALAYGVMDGYIYNLKAVEQIRAEEYDAALELIEKGKAAGDSQQDLAFNEAVAWENKGDFAKALELFEAYAAQYGADDTVGRELEFLRSRQSSAQDIPEGGSGDGAASGSGENASGDGAPAGSEGASGSGASAGSEGASGSGASAGSEGTSGNGASAGSEEASENGASAGGESAPAAGAGSASGEETSSSAYSGEARG